MPRKTKTAARPTTNSQKARPVRGEAQNEKAGGSKKNWKAQSEAFRYAQPHFAISL